MKKQVLLLCAIAICTVTLNAQNQAWDNSSTDGLWSTATNWTGDKLPVPFQATADQPLLQVNVPPVLTVRVP